MVIYRDIEGKPGYHQSEEIDEAVRYVESLRNGRGVEQARIFRLEEVQFEFRPYFRVELSPVAETGIRPVPSPAPEPAAMEAEPDPSPAPAAPAWGEPSATPADPDSSETVPVGTGVGRRGLFGR
jgi:hypothetical protein